MKTLLRAWSILCLLVLTSLSLPAQQAERIYTPESIPNVQLSDSTRLVSDPADYLTPEVEAQLNASLRNIRHRYGVEYVIVLVPSIGDRDIEFFSTELFRLWGLGEKHSNNGLLLLVAIEQNLMRFEVGYGLEGDLTDATVSKIWRRDMLPYFSSEDYARGLAVGVEAVGRVLEDSQWRTDGTSRRPQSSVEGFDLLKLFLLFGFGVSLISVSILYSSIKQVRTPEVARERLPALSSQFSNTILMLIFLCLPMGIILLLCRPWVLKRIKRLAALCPHCHAEAMAMAQEGEQVTPYLTPYQRIEQRIGSVRFALCKCASCQHGEVVATPVASTPYTRCTVCGSRAVQRVGQQRLRTPRGYIIVRTEHRCLCCDHTSHQDRRDNDDELMQAAAIGTILGLGRAMGRGGGFGGGGFGGGSFGGGSSGGGGFTGRW